jgi:arabinogalactan oligomer / maltooligosaccharide transport system substrate-binding protein
MKRFLVLLLIVLCVAPMAMAQVTAADINAAGTVKILLWSKEGDADLSLQFVKAYAGLFTLQYPNVTFEIINKNVENLRQDFQTASLAGSPPDLLWTVSDHAGPFTTADIIQPVDSLFDLSKFVDSALAAVKLGGKTWGVPISNGNQLMLIYNKTLVPKPPTTTTELFALAAKMPKGVYPLVYNQTEPFWMVPWLGGFKGSVFAADGLTPTLNTPAMVNTLKFLKDLRDKKIVPPESDYNGADTLFKEGKAAMIINGDWSLGGYKDAMKANFGVARIPKVAATGLWPAPYTSGIFFMIPKDLTGPKLVAVRGYIQYMVSLPVQIEQVKKLTRLPGLKVALSNEAITSDPILKGSADQMVVGTPMPTVVEMRANWDAMKPDMIAVLSGTMTAEDAAADMQKAAEAGIKALQ